MNRVVSDVLALAISLLWVFFGVPVVVRWFGVAMPIPRLRRYHESSESFHVLVDGLLSIGFGAAVFAVSSYMLLSRVFHSPPEGASDLFIEVLGWLVGGVVIGWINAAFASKQQN